jgi:uncharacterized membrane protein YgcG
MLQPPVPCEHLVGIFRVRRCGENATARCARCGRAFCDKHLRGTPPTCVDCLRPRTTTFSDDDLSWSSSPVSSGSSDAPFEGGGGAFGGGGASGSWDPSSSPTELTPDDYAAFDAMTESDHGSSGYDS